MMAAMYQTLLPFLGACLLIAASPGPSTVLIIRRSLTGHRHGMATVLGNETGVFVWGVVAAFGLTALLAASQLAYDALRLVGAVVLVVLGLQALRAARRTRGAAVADGDEPASAPAPVRESAWRSYRAGLALNLANPKAAVFALSFLPQFVPAGAPQLPAMVALAAVWALFETGYYACYVWGVGRMRRLIDRAAVRRRLEQVSGGVLIALGLRMALEG
ncbi:Threonine/homoserine/homoserine lactone efflux protein [Streptomyces radiopugnans]|uniref:Threonine/homoserine/homoserine lactone efflux protein n=2 Tax=Streptomyces radiopugnans TaxID=403935 RepID=A0A1H9G6C8_9ACTN|nr:Threonine/homoserine/homoserine lactone efflux protein [Streptomyces radiopugnans]